MRRKIFEVRCDRCGRPIDVPNEQIGYVYLGETDPETGDVSMNNEFENKDFCPDCMAQIRAYISGEQTAASLGVHFSDEPAEDGEFLDKSEIKQILKESKQPKNKGGRPPKKQTKLDIPKAQALRDAGWTIEAIAEECKVTPPTVKKWTTAPDPKQIRKPLEFGGGI